MSPGPDARITSGGALAARRDAPVGGQAVLEGVMMRGVSAWAVAVRTPDGRIDYSALGRPVDAFTELRFAGSTKVADIKSVADGLPEVEAIYTTAGDPDALVRIRVRDMQDLTRVVDLLRRSGRVTGTKTLMVLDAMHPEQTFGP